MPLNFATGITTSYVYPSGGVYITLGSTGSTPDVLTGSYGPYIIDSYAIDTNKYRYLEINPTSGNQYIQISSGIDPVSSYTRVSNSSVSVSSNLVTLLESTGSSEISIGSSGLNITSPALLIGDGGSNYINMGEGSISLSASGIEIGTPTNYITLSSGFISISASSITMPNLNVNGQINSVYGVTGSTTSTTATATTCVSFRTTDNKAYVVWGYVIGELGTGATSAVGGKVEGVFRNQSSGVSGLYTVGVSSTVYEDLSGSPTFTLTTSGVNVLLQVTGLAGQTITWYGTLYYIAT